jgi:hypothetical protein
MLKCWSCKVDLDEETGYHLLGGAAICSDCEN